MTDTADKPPVLLVGANIRFLAENAVRHGHNIFTVDYYGDYDLVGLCGNLSSLADGDGLFELKSLLDLCHGVKNAGVVYGPGFENDVLTLSRLRKIGKVIGCDPSAVRKSRDPESVSRASKAWDFKYPAISYKKNKSMRAGQWLIKPFAGMGGVGVRQMADVDETSEGLSYYQKYIPGFHSSAVIVSSQAEATCVGVLAQILGDECFGAAGFRYVGNIFPHPFTSEMEETLNAIAEALTMEFELKGLWGFDFIYDGGITLIEINPRPSAGIGAIALNTMNDFLGLHMAAVMGDETSLIVDPGPPGRFAAQGRVFARDDVIFADPEKWLSLGARDIPHEGARIMVGDPVLTVTAEAESYSKALCEIQVMAERLHSELLPVTAHPV